MTYEEIETRSKSNVKCFGDIEFLVYDKADDSLDIWGIKNTVLLTGRNALAKALSGDMSSFYVNRMIFGTNGTSGGVPKYVDASRQGLFGITELSKPVISTVSDQEYIASFTTVIGFNEAVGATLNEMALQMANGDLYSMKTFKDLNKTNTQQITVIWRISFM